MVSRAFVADVGSGGRRLPFKCLTELLAPSGYPEALERASGPNERRTMTKLPPTWRVCERGRLVRCR